MTEAVARPDAGHPLAGRLAAPSFVIPAGVAENAHFLAGKTDEAGLCLFETQACLAYGPDDLPPDLAALPLRWHAHLPVDLPWPDSPGSAARPARAAARAALGVLHRVAFLRPRCAVLHPPAGAIAAQRRLLADFAAFWHTAVRTPLLLENVEHCDVISLGDGFLQDIGAGLCLDVGHLLGYGQGRLLASELPERAALLHWSAPGERDRHLPLTALTPPQRRTAAALAARLPRAVTHLIEVFSWSGYTASLPVLAQLAAARP